MTISTDYTESFLPIISQNVVPLGFVLSLYLQSKGRANEEMEIEVIFVVGTIKMPCIFRFPK
jgi:hypothetical protein